MQKSQYLLIALGLLAVLTLSLMPKVVVNNRQEVALNMDEADRHQEAGQVNMDRTAIEQSLQQLKSSITLSQKETAAEELIGLFTAANQYDSAAYYSAQLATETLTEKWMEKTARLYFDAYTYAMTPEKTQQMAEKAEQALQSWLSAFPKALDAKVMLGVVQVSTKTPMEGIGLIRSVLEEDPNNEMALFQMGMFSIQSGQFDRAVPRFEQLVKLDSENLQARYYLGISYKETGRKDKALEQLRIVREKETAPLVIESVDKLLKELNP